MKTKNNEIVIEVTLNENSIFRNYAIDDLDNVTNETFGAVIADMIETLRDADKPLV